MEMKMAMLKAKSVELFWSSLSIYSALAFGLAYLCPPARDCDAFRSLVSIAMFVRGTH